MQFNQSGGLHRNGTVWPLSSNLSLIPCPIIFSAVGIMKFTCIQALQRADKVQESLHNLCFIGDGVNKL